MLIHYHINILHYYHHHHLPFSHFHYYLLLFIITISLRHFHFFAIFAITCHYIILFSPLLHATDAIIIFNITLRHYIIILLYLHIDTPLLRCHIIHSLSFHFHYFITLILRHYFITLIRFITITCFHAITLLLLPLHYFHFIIIISLFSLHY